MAVPGAGWSVIWGPEGDYAYVTDPEGNIIYRWFANDPDYSTMTWEMLQNTEAIINEANQGAGDSAVPDEGGGYSEDELWDALFDAFGSGDTNLAAQIMDALEQLFGAGEEASAWWEQTQAEADAEAEARYQERLEESRAYSEAQALASQHMRQEQNWGYAAANAPGAGAGILSNLLPAFLPQNIAQSLYGYGKRMGTEYDPAWPGGTALNEAQMTPTGQDWIDYLVEQGYPSYLWER